MIEKMRLTRADHGHAVGNCRGSRAALPAGGLSRPASCVSAFVLMNAPDSFHASFVSHRVLRGAVCLMSSWANTENPTEKRKEGQVSRGEDIPPEFRIYAEAKASFSEPFPIPSAIEECF